MRYLRRVEQKTRRNKVRNQMTWMALKMKPLQSQIQQMVGHVVRMPESRNPRMVWEARYKGRRTRGRPRTKWQDNIQNALLKKGMDLETGPITGTRQKEMASSLPNLYT
jgi:hypothetical protein